ncbi:phosphatidylglycerophosphate phosphatase 1, chloroplastic/mitochondrial isoform X2 [Rhododendron vialii]|uniref:phosphatidylglycerophosphate phosphatase 1, chloroplastic/mitochondrial isoform X2 n=1 Tax=Rhododendron vialii TaxID=182163 RepID=UPI002660214F|nr:phosphatidylglycerophosphate phosphatase 1, chloroplastic/mitochondrial isoform X2 [Rhododendron vialii]
MRLETMHSTSAAPCPWQVCYYPIPNRYQFHRQPLHLSTKPTTPISSPLNCQTHFRNNPFLTLPSTNSCISDQHRKNPDDKREFSQEFCSSIDENGEINKTQRRKSPEGKEEAEREAKGRSSLSTNMWWADFKGALGQRINLEGVVSSVSVLARDRHLALPHVSVPDIRYIDWDELRSKGFRAVVFDKDNTITVPYSLRLWGPLGSSIERCKSVFGDDIAVFSNSAGVKKPGGTAEEIEKHFGCESSRLIMVGDRPFTDVVYGNRNGFLTILTEPLSLAEEPFIVKQIRKLEVALVNRWSKRGLKPTSHGLLPDAGCCVKDPPPL